MAFNIEAVLWYGFLLDSSIATLVSFCCAKWYKKWYKKKYKFFYRQFPVTKGWTISYFVLVLWVGFGLYRLGILPW